MDKIPKLDLHIHSVYSDGTFTPSEICSKAKDLEMDLIALTDHNTIAGFSDFKKACKKYKIKGICGVELSTDYMGKEIHVLGYFKGDSDLRSKAFSPLKKIIKDYKDIKRHQNEAIIQKFVDCGRFDVSIPDFYKFAEILSPDGNYNRVHIAKYLTYKGLVKDIEDAFNYIGEGCDFFVEKETISTGKAIKAIQRAGGVAVIAHLGEYDFTDDEVKLFFNFCRNNGVWGFECFHPSHSEDDVYLIIDNVINTIDKSSSNYNFYITMGSDFHGDNKPNKIGDTYPKKMNELVRNVFNISSVRTYKRLEAFAC